MAHTVSNSLVERASAGGRLVPANEPPVKSVVQSALIVTGILSFICFYFGVAMTLRSSRGKTADKGKTGNNYAN